MNKTMQIALGAAVVLLLGTTAVLYQKYQRTSSDYLALQSSEETSRTRYGRAINEIAAIQDSLNAIVLGDSAGRLVSAQLADEQRLTETSTDAALERIAVLKAGIERTKERITQLDEQLKKNGVKISGLNRMVANLKKTVVEKESEIALLAGRVDSLNTQVATLATEVQEGEETIREQTVSLEDKRRELGTVYYVIGSTKDLKTAGVVEAKGGLLGMGKTLEPTGKAEETLFTPVDTDLQTVIAIPAEKAKVVSDQPPSSYQLQPVGKQLELRIIDPKEFRKVKQVVIVTT